MGNSLTLFVALFLALLVPLWAIPADDGAQIGGMRRCPSVHVPVVEVQREPVVAQGWASEAASRSCRYWTSFSITQNNEACPGRILCVADASMTVSVTTTMYDDGFWHPLLRVWS